MVTRGPIGLGILLLGSLLYGCGGGSGSGTVTIPPATQAAAPTMTTAAAQNGAVVASVATTTAGAAIYYTLDGTTPTNASQIYEAPFLVASNLTVKAIAAEAPEYLNSNVTTQSFTPNIASGMLVWSDEFANSTNNPAQPNPQVWTYDTGTDCCGNNELETYCAWGATASGCNPATPNAYVGTDGYLHIVVEELTPGIFTAGNFTSARLKTEGLFSFQYGRIEARMLLPESQGMWPAFWLLGNNIVTVGSLACGETDVMEHIDGSDPQNVGYDWVKGSIHGTGLDGGILYAPPGFSAAAWHTYGMIWTKGQVQYYVDDPANIYATFTSSNTTGTWPFDTGPQFVILNLAVGGSWPGSPDATTVFPSEVQVDYVRIYTN